MLLGIPMGPRLRILSHLNSSNGVALAPTSTSAPYTNGTSTYHDDMPSEPTQGINYAAVAGTRRTAAAVVAASAKQARK